MKVVLFILKRSLEKHGWRTFLDTCQLSGFSTSEGIRAAMRSVEHFAMWVFFTNSVTGTVAIFDVLPAGCLRAACSKGIKNLSKRCKTFNLGVDVPPTESYNILICNSKNVISIEIWFRKAMSSPPKKNFASDFGGFWIALYRSETPIHGRTS